MAYKKSPKGGYSANITCFRRKFQLTVLFGIGLLVVAVTITRLPLILDESDDLEIRSVRSRWASIEMFCACVVANGAFYYALIKDLSRGHSNSPSQMTPLGVRQSSFRTSQSSGASKSPKQQEIILDGYKLPATVTRFMKGGKWLDNGLPIATHVEDCHPQPKDDQHRNIV